ncbi:peptidylprolyl isomerase [Chromatocurvus halotolerans]|uniref:peptidylprolyl isomerase n=1 Tax=Chromatocurvus halotolerans TaxID=1132028 RepID=A0A4R2KPD9_9GAMM|nr:peptidylprolyl isomerase [Chromatocurvus halotolerans]TCO76061.1 peptidyl-prolyl cis-trans isomerase A (cyclophilin A) [Chromatocurvus halotolerans]
MPVTFRMRATPILGIGAFLLLWTVSLFSGLPANADAEDPVIVVLETALGTIHIEVLVDKAPETATYFLRLVDGGHYAGATFYRSGALDGKETPQVIQGGLLHSWLQGDAGREPPTGVPTLPFTENTALTGIPHHTGTVSMARDLLQTGDVIPEFFICLRDAPNLDHGQSQRPDANGFPAFGRVVHGMETLRDIAAGETRGRTHISLLQNQILSAPVGIIRAYRADHLP